MGSADLGVLVQYLGNGLVVGTTYALAALGLTLIFGHMGLINFAHGALYMLGAFLAYTTIVLAGLPFVLGALVAVVAVMIVGAAIERGVIRPIRRTETLFRPMVATIALAVIIPNAALLIWGPTPKRLPAPIAAQSLELGPLPFAPRDLVILAGAAIAITAAHLFFTRTRSGAAMRGTFQDPTAASLVGLDVNRIYVLTFAIGSGLAALAGVLVSTVVLITPTIGQLVALKSFIVVILGGLRSFTGAVVGGLLVGVCESLAAGYLAPSYKDAVGLVMLVLILVLLPRGIFGGKSAVKA